MPPRNLNILLFAAAVSLLCHVTYRNTRTAVLVGEAIELIDRNYVDTVDKQALVTAAMQGLVDELDEHSSYFEVEEYEEFRDSIQQEFAGIGIYVSQPEEGKPIRVITPLVGSPALEAGVLPNDQIVGVDGQDVSTMPLSDVSDRLKGTPGTRVAIELMRGEDESDQSRVALEVVRATIELESVIGDHRNEAHQWVYRIKDEPTVAYVRMKSFGEKTVSELADVLRTLNNDYEALVLDLRGNGGGLLYAARDVCDMFLSGGAIVSTRIRGGEIEDEYFATEGTLVDESIPLAVLVDQNSASASEIVAACLQDNRRATVVGVRSFGKGTVQEILPLQYGKSALRLTVAKYYRPNNHNIHRSEDATDEDEWGVTPDEGFVIPMEMEALIELNNRWQIASYPALAGIELPKAPSDPEQADSQDDPALEADSDESPGDEEPEELELSEAAQRNVERGPASLAHDPPLRAAVGNLLNMPVAEAEIGDDGAEQSDSDAEKSAA